MKQNAKDRSLPDWLPAHSQLTEYASWLVDVGSQRGLVGPNEIDRVWDRHILNCAVVALDPKFKITATSQVVDIGSGAGLPGVVWALVRPDLSLTLVESKLRRTSFLEETLERFELKNRVVVVRSRIEDFEPTAPVDIVTARAVAPLEQLVKWTLPIMRRNGRILALKGETVESEVDSARQALGRLGGGKISVELAGEDWLAQPTRVAVVRKG